MVCNNNSYNSCSHLIQFAVRAAHQVLEWPEKRGSLFAVLTAYLVLRERSAMEQVGVNYKTMKYINL